MSEPKSEGSRIKIPVRIPKARPPLDDSAEYDASTDCTTTDSKILRILLNCSEGATGQSSLQSSLICRQCGSRGHASWNCPTGNSCPICSQSSELSSTKQCNFVAARSWSSRSGFNSAKISKVNTSIRIILQKGHKPSPIIYSSLISSYIADRNPDSAHRVLERMRMEGVMPDAPCFNAVLDAWCETGDMEKVLQVLIAMRNSGCEFTVSTYNTIIKGLGITGRTDEALNLVRRMARPNSTLVKPNIRTFNILMNAFCEIGDVGEARSVIGLIRTAGLSPDTVTYNTLIKAYGKCRQPEMAESVVREMQNSYLRPNQRTFAAVVQSYCDLKRMDEACAMVENMKMYGVEPNTIVFNILIKGYANISRPDLAEKVIEMMEEYNVKPDIASFSSVMDAWCTDGNPLKAREILSKMTRIGIPPDTEVYSVLAKGYLRARMGAEAEEILTEMEELNLTPNVITYTTIISCCSSGAKMDDAMRIYHRMESTGVKANIFTYRTLIWGFSEGRNPALAEKMLKIMEEAGVQPDARCYDQVAIAWQSVGLWQEAQRVTEMKKEKLANGDGSGVESTKITKKILRESTASNYLPKSGSRIENSQKAATSTLSADAGVRTNGSARKNGDQPGMKTNFSNGNGFVGKDLKTSSYGYENGNGSSRVNGLDAIKARKLSVKNPDDMISKVDMNGGTSGSSLDIVNGFGDGKYRSDLDDLESDDGALFEREMNQNVNLVEEDDPEKSISKRKNFEDTSRKAVIKKRGFNIKRRVQETASLTPSKERNAILANSNNGFPSVEKKKLNNNLCFYDVSSAYGLGNCTWKSSVPKNLYRQSFSSSSSCIYPPIPLSVFYHSGRHIPYSLQYPSRPKLFCLVSTALPARVIGFGRSISGPSRVLIPTKDGDPHGLTLSLENQSFSTPNWAWNSSKPFSHQHSFIRYHKNSSLGLYFLQSSASCLL